jgi:Bacterial Ig-like domain (group 3)
MFGLRGRIGLAASLIAAVAALVLFAALVTYTAAAATVTAPMQAHPDPAGPPPPTDVVGPSIEGTRTTGSTLVANNGIWLDAASFLDRWSRCASDGSNCDPVATGSTYPLTAKDIGAEMLLDVTATSASGGTASVPSSLFGPIVTPAGNVLPPAVTDEPGLSGTPQVGVKVEGQPVTMSNNPGYAYQWYRCASQCTAIGGATMTTYTPSAPDLGDSLVFAETGTNDGGSTPVRSPRSSTVTAPTATTLQLTRSTIVAGRAVTLVATVTSATALAPPKGRITFANSGTPVRGCNSVPTHPSGTTATVTCRTRFPSTPTGLRAVFTPAAGSLVTGSDSTTSGFVVGHAPTTATLKVPTHLTLGHRITFVAKVNPTTAIDGISPAGTVLFVDRGKPIKGCRATLSSRTARCSITYHKPGRHAIVAYYLGDASFSGSASKIHKRSVTVAKPSGFVSALMAWTFDFSPASTQVMTLNLTGLVPGVSVALVCSGQGCPLHHHVYRTTKRSCGKGKNCKPLNLAARLHHAQLHPGAKLTVRLTHRGWLGKYYQFVMRAGQKPKIVTSCLAVGVTQPNVACTPH